MTKSIKKYDIVLVDFGEDTVGSEQGYVRPALIIQNDIGNLHSTTTIVMPLTTKIKRLHQPTHTLIKKGKSKGLDEDSMLLGEAMRQVSEQRIIRYMGTITDPNEKKEIRRVYNANFGE